MLRLPENLSRESVEVFGAIMRFMGDSGKKPTPKQEVEYPTPFLLSFILYSFSFWSKNHFYKIRYTHYIVSRAISTEALRDEILCCLIRQVTKNPKEYCSSSFIIIHCFRFIFILFQLHSSLPYQPFLQGKRCPWMAIACLMPRLCSSQWDYD